jgi:enamine deaminase RidA (YjgF/YER057c/UK114 family)
MRNIITASGWVCAILVSILVWNSGNLPRVLATNGLRFLNPKGLSTPVARYSHAVVVPASEGLIFVSGEGGDDGSGKPVSDDVVVQTKQTMENIKTALEAAGSDFSHVVKMNIYLTDMSRMPELRKVRDAYLDAKRAPAMTTAKVLELVGGIKVEIEVIAVPSK